MGTRRFIQPGMIAAWLITFSSCIALLLLITTGLRVTRFLRLEDVKSVKSVDSKVSATGSRSGSMAIVSVLREQQATSAAVPESSELGYDVLPPSAAHGVGRKLPKMLVVGNSPDMFATLDEALEAVIPGDLVEIRTNRPLLMRPCKLNGMERSDLSPIVIRAGSGAQPLLRLPLGDVICSDGIPLQVEGLHFVAPGDEGIVSVFRTNASIIVRGCSLTSLPGPHAQFRNLVCFHDEALRPHSGPPDSITIENCFLRPWSTAVWCNNGTVDIQLTNCLGVGPYYATVYSVVPGQASRNLLLSHCTFYGNWAAVSIGTDTPEPEDVSSRPVNVKCDATLMAERPLHLTNSASVEWQSYVRQGAIAWHGAGNVYGDELAVSDHSVGLLEWRRLWKIETDLNSIQARIEFMSPPPNNELHRALPADFSVKSIEGVRDSRLENVGCDVLRLPVPPAMALQPYELKSTN